MKLILETQSPILRYSKPCRLLYKELEFIEEMDKTETVDIIFGQHTKTLMSCIVQSGFNRYCFNPRLYTDDEEVARYVSNKAYKSCFLKPATVIEYNRVIEVLHRGIIKDLAAYDEDKTIVGKVYGTKLLGYKHNGH